MKSILILILSFSFTHSAFGQKVSFEDLYGKWKVTGDYIFGVGIGPKDIDTVKARIKKCEAEGLIIVDSSGIHEKGDLCGVVRCFKEKEFIYYERKIVQDKQGIDNHTRDRYRWEAEDTSIVSREFVDMIDNRYSKPEITVIDTQCLCDWGSFTYKIYVINSNEFALYSSVDIEILERIKQ